MVRRKISIIDHPGAIPAPFMRVGIYCRVSSAKVAQLDSLSSQASDLVRFVMDNPMWMLRDIYLEVAEASHRDNRKQFQRLLKDCEDKKLDVVITRTVARFGRNTEETISDVRKLIHAGAVVIFRDDNIDSRDPQFELILSLISAVAEGENLSRSGNTIWGIHRKLENGTSSIYSRTCYGYKKTERGELIINYREAQVVEKIFDWYLSGMSILGIIDKLESEGIPSPTGKKHWPKRTVDSILSNEKYCGNVLVIKTYTRPIPDKRRVPNRGEKNQFLMIGHHPAIIDKKDFEAVQEEKKRRTNITEDGARKNSKFSSKRTATEARLKAAEAKQNLAKARQNAAKASQAAAEKHLATAEEKLRTALSRQENPTLNGSKK